MGKPTETAYFDWQAEVMPPYFADPVGERYFGVLASLMNHIGLQGDTYALTADLLTNANAPSDALPRIGADRRLTRGPTETDAQHKARLRGAWDAWLYAGTAYAITMDLARIGLTAEVKQNTDWDWDGDTSKWSRFWVVITSHPWVATGNTWGDGSIWGGGQTWGSSATVQEVQTVHGIVRQWKPAHCYCENIIIVFDGVTWAANQPDGTWGTSNNRTTAAAYWGG